MSPILETTFATWALGDQLVTPKGGKICLLSSNGACVSLESSFAPMQAPFGPSTYDKQPASRINMVLQCGEPTQAFFERLNEWTKDYTQAHAERLFKKPMTREEIDAGYRSPLSTAGEDEDHGRGPEGVQVLDPRRKTPRTPRGLAESQPEADPLDFAPLHHGQGVWMGHPLHRHTDLRHSAGLLPFCAFADPR